MAFRTPPNLGVVIYPHSLTVRITAAQLQKLRSFHHQSFAESIRAMIDATPHPGSTAGKTSRRSNTDGR